MNFDDTVKEKRKQELITERRPLEHMARIAQSKINNLALFTYDYEDDPVYLYTRGDDFQMELVRRVPLCEFDKQFQIVITRGPFPDQNSYDMVVPSDDPSVAEKVEKLSNWLEELRVKINRIEAEYQRLSRKRITPRKAKIT